MSKLLRFLVWMGIAAGITVGISRAVALRWWKVPSGDPYLEASVAPTLRGGDWVLLWRLSAPRLGDLVLCPEPNAPGREVLARIAGVQGDRVELDGGMLRINGRKAAANHPCPEDHFTTIDPETRAATPQSCVIEELGSRNHPRGEVTSQLRAADHKSFEVPAGQVVLISDNRQFPYDSRDFGLVDRASCRESVFFRLVSAAGFSDVATRLTWIP
ncbi:MAG TPA: signal peptidase I [Polyangiaceae bacterium]|nr:signal peptidase I [Polyangiaceae bacterium]